MVKISLDFAYCDKLQDVLRRIGVFGGKIIDFVAEGPAGGNPLLTLSFPDRERATEFILVHDPDEAALHSRRIEAVS